VNTGVTFAVFNLCTAVFGLPPAVANLIGWAAGFANSFVWNRAWTFADRRSLPTRSVLLRFAAVNGLALAVSESVLLGLEALASAGGLTAQYGSTLVGNGIEGVAIGAALAVNYLLSSRWAFAPARLREP